MKLKIIDYFWSVGHRTKRKGSHKIPLAEGELREINYVQFRIDKVEKDKAQISVIRRDGTVIKEITVEKGKSPYNTIGKVNYKIDLVGCNALRGLFCTQNLVKG